MKKLIPLFLLFTCLINAQEYKLEERTITGVFEKTGKTKSELFSSINRWISINYNSSINVIQMNNIDSGTIIVKGINEVKYKDDLTKILSPKSNIEYATMKVSHLIEINIKDGRYRVIYKVVDLAIQDSGYNDLVINCINFNKVDDESIQNYNSPKKKLKRSI